MMRHRITQLSDTIRSFFASNSFFYISLGLFIVSSVWVATASLYPMAFDENFHVGLIQIYASSWLPHGIDPTADMAVYGAATADTSYLFHYLMSYPYRLTQAFAIPFDVSIVLLRFINILFVVGALVVFRKLLLEVKISKPITHLSIVLFTLVPIVPVLAGQVNYDNLLLFIVALAFLMTFRISAFIRLNSSFPAIQSLLLIGILLFGIATKYAFIPLAAGLISWLILFALTQKKVRSLSFLRSFRIDLSRVRRGALLGVASLLVIALFFAARYGVNFLQYGSPIPACDVVFDDKACLKYGPWARNYYLMQNLPSTFTPLLLPEYIARYWVPGMSMRLTFAVAGPTNGYQTRQPLPLLQPFLVAATTVTGLLLIVSVWIFKNRHILLSLLLLTLAIYLMPLIWKLYQLYTVTGEAVAVNGRYLLPFLIMATALLLHSSAISLRHVTKRLPLPLLSLLGLVLIIAAGGGITTYVIQAEPHWFWQGWGQDSHAVLQAVFSWFVIR
jgi:hypothetical protein